MDLWKKDKGGNLSMTLAGKIGYAQALLEESYDMIEKDMPDYIPAEDLEDFRENLDGVMRILAEIMGRYPDQEEGDD